MKLARNQLSLFHYHSELDIATGHFVTPGQSALSTRPVPFVGISIEPRKGQGEAFPLAVVHDDGSDQFSDQSLGAFCRYRCLSLVSTISTAKASELSTRTMGFTYRRKFASSWLLTAHSIDRVEQGLW